MALPGSTSTTDDHVARRVREQFVAHAAAVLPTMSTAIAERMVVLVNQSSNSREAQSRRDALMAYQKVSRNWTQGTATAWRQALTRPKESTRGPVDSSMLELIGDDEVENKILSSRLALGVIEKSGSMLNDLRMRMREIESLQEMSSQDILRPEVVCQLVVEEWCNAGLERAVWISVQDVILQCMLEAIPAAYKLVNDDLIKQGILPEIDLRSQVRLTAPGPLERGQAAYEESTAGGVEHTGPGDDTSDTPMSRAKFRAQGLLGQIKRALGDRREDVVDRSTSPQPPSAALIRALDRSSAETVQQGQYAGSGDQGGSAGGGGGAGGMAGQPVVVGRVASNLRERASSLKKEASTQGEKAIIEIVALMFQSILSEERIPASIRVWFARLQTPVIRVALFEPEFFNTLHHPARKLMDHMGSCVLGFDSREISGSALESEIKRVVQVIEQYPDTGRRVFQLVYDEFQKFLAKYLTEKGSSQRVVNLAQQVEQKETLAIQYTIEMRNMLDSMPVREEIREFLFKVWAEVLAVAAIKHGPQHEDAIALKRSASDLVWAASAKPSRSERARVISDLPKLLQSLRQGMVLLGFDLPQQEAQIKLIRDTLADAFLSKTESIPQERIDAMAERLTHLEDFIIEDGTGDIPLDAASVEMLVGIDSSSIVVVADGGAKPTQAMLAWAQELQTGTWYMLDHEGKNSQVQFVWRSDRRQLHLFASVDGRSYLIQARRLAAYLQAGLLVPQEEEALTVRATRDALAKLEADPARLSS